MYRALYRKYRPKTFDEVVGQRHITDTLKSQLVSARLSHAYLFTGSRGTGKTSCAKILAKAVNCENPRDGNPCNACDACIGIDSGGILDVLELDAASNNGVDHVRALRDEAVYTPAAVRMRVYIIDEVHMLSTSAFNALLKILEEPPSHLLFILATTELHKVPATILSRCQRYSFKRLQPSDIEGRIAQVAAMEGINLEPAAAALLSRLSDGALRDALSLLDQCGAGDAPIDAARVYECLGLAGSESANELLRLISNGETGPAIELFEKLYGEGKDVSAVLDELLTLCRDILIEKTAARVKPMGAYPAEDNDLSAQQLVRMADVLQGAIAGLSRSANRRIDGELCVIRLCDPSLSGDLSALNARISRLEAGYTPGEKPDNTEHASGKDGSHIEPSPVIDEREPPEAENEPPWDDVPAAPEAIEEPSKIDVPQDKAGPVAEEEDANALWQELLTLVKPDVSPGAYTHLSNGQMARGELKGDLLTVTVIGEFNMKVISALAVKQALQQRCAELLGRSCRVDFRLEGKEGGGEEKFNELLKFSSRFDNIKIV